MTDNEISLLLSEYASGPDKLEAALLPLEEALVRYIPFQGAWSIHEHVIHLVESEINNFTRWRSILAQPESSVFVIQDEENWARRIDYNRENRQEYLEVFRLLRSISSAYLRVLPREKWEDDCMVREYQGRNKRFNLRQTIELYARHVDMHLEYVDRNIKAWEEK